MSDTTTTATEITAADERVQDIADFFGENPEAVLAEAKQAASDLGETLDDVLDAGDENVTDAEMGMLADALGSAEDEEDNDL